MELHQQNLDSATRWPPRTARSLTRLALSLTILVLMGMHADGFEDLFLAAIGLCAWDDGTTGADSHLATHHGLTAAGYWPERQFPTPDAMRLTHLRSRIAGTDRSCLDRVVEAIYEPHFKDSATGCYDGRIGDFTVEEIHRAQQHVTRTGQPAALVVATLVNLSGINHAAHNRVEVANRHYRDLVAIVCRTLIDAGADLVPIRLTATTVAALVVGLDTTGVHRAVTIIDAATRTYTATTNLGGAPLALLDHPDHPGDPQHRGVRLDLRCLEIATDADARRIIDAAVNPAEDEGRYVASGQGHTARTDGTDTPATSAAYRAAPNRVCTQVGTRSQESRPPSARPDHRPISQPLGLSDSGATRYPSPDEARYASVREKLAAQPISSVDELIATYYEPWPIDEVTGFHNGQIDRFKNRIVSEAQQFVAAIPDWAFYVCGDIANLSGLNQHVGGRVAADIHYRALADIFATELTLHGARVIAVRIGGDEIAAVVTGIDEDQIRHSMHQITHRSADYARTHGLDHLEHPKHPGDPRFRGVGLHLGHAEIVPGIDVTDIFDAADLELDQSKSAE
ncbi:hypothetical protein JK358_35965 [Nocardia sp. 2]|uniref:GGDEF domain-containing protein n=1 Tax=Nocardia acididurans TaxID=2802282 RepID=A0ABS1MGL1_9NOCA|nr:hypothetical protein [Nocardia acididurans]MBL1079813.1 hypothetical protein [Nocardia acididurans]